MNWPAIAFVARAERRRRRASFVALAVMAGLTGSLAVGGTTLARRTATAFDRLERATDADEVRIGLLGSDQEESLRMAAELAAQPGVQSARIAQVAVARLEAEEVVYVGIVGAQPASDTDGSTQRTGPLRPVVVEGRAADPEAADEVVVSESLAREFGMRPGFRMELSFLTRDEFYAFDAEETLEGRGPRFEAVVVGLIRYPGTDLGLPPIFSSSAMVGRHPEAFQAGVLLMAQVDGPAGLRSLDLAADSLNSRVSLPPEADEFTATDITDTSAAGHTAAATTRVLVVGLMVLTGVSVLAGLVAMGQAMVRHRGLFRTAHYLELAFGMDRWDRAAARVLAMAPVAVVAAVSAAIAGLLAGGLEPPGGVRFLEPHPGFRFNAAVVSAGSAGILVATLVMAAAISLVSRPGTSSARPGHRSGSARRLARLGGPLPIPLGIRMAFERGPGPVPVPVGSSIAAVVLGVMGVAGVLVFAASLHRLVQTPLRFGYPGDLVILDAGSAIVEELAADDRVVLVVGGAAGKVEIAGERVSASTQRAHKGTLEWELAGGRPPATPDEIVLGTRVSARLDRSTGDTVVVTDAEGSAVELAVVGVGVTSEMGDGVGIGQGVALSDAGLARFALSTPFPAVVVSVEPGARGERLRSELSARYEVTPASPPEDVRNLRDLGGIPTALGSFLAGIGLVAIGHAVVVAARRRARDVATLRVLGFTPKQATTTLIVMAGATGLSGVVLGLPTGVALGSTVWRAVAEGAGVVGDPLLRGLGLALVALVVMSAALALAAGPAHRAGRRTPSAILRSE